MIPKTIHYVWLGNRPKPKKIEKCIASWNKFCPDYEIIEWNELNFDINSHNFVKEAYEIGNFAFSSDVIRLEVLYKYGGIYVDADVEFLKPIDDLLYNEAFIGFEIDEYVNSGQILGTVANNPLINEHLKQYDSLSYSACEDITKIACPRLLTKLLVDKGLRLDGTEQQISDMHIYPSDYFNPFDTKTGKLSKTENSYSIHWSAHSWTNRSRVIKRITRTCHRFLGVNCFAWIKRFLEL